MCWDSKFSRDFLVCSNFFLSSFYFVGWRHVDLTLRFSSKSQKGVLLECPQFSDRARIAGSAAARWQIDVGGGTAVLENGPASKAIGQSKYDMHQLECFTQHVVPLSPKVPNLSSDLAGFVAVYAVANGDSLY